MRCKMKNGFSIFGILISLAMVLVGVATLNGEFSEQLTVPSASSVSISSLYSTGYASFGGDFYTYVNNNTAKAAENVSDVASAVRAVSSNLRDIYKIMERMIGIALIGFGAFGVCLFGSFINKQSFLFQLIQRNTKPE